VVTEYFAPGTEPLEFSRAQRLQPVDAANGLLAFPGFRAKMEYRRFIEQGPEFREGFQRHTPSGLRTVALRYLEKRGIVTFAAAPGDDEGNAARSALDPLARVVEADFL
jgi:hypothetical protein